MQIHDSAHDYITTSYGRPSRVVPADADGNVEQGGKEGDEREAGQGMGR